MPSKVVELVVNNDLCIGCGLCVYKCSNEALTMKWSEDGFPVVTETNLCDCDGKCIDVCPFNPFPSEEVRTEKEIANIFLPDAVSNHQKIGKFTNIYAGYSQEFRITSSSGGIGTYLSKKLLEQEIVSHIISVKESNIPGQHFEYSVSSSINTVTLAAKTRYFPVTLAAIFSEIKKLNGHVAIVGVGCFIKAVRLAQYKEPVLRQKIRFLIGIICGGEKSRFFTEYLGSKLNVQKNEIGKPDYRKKDFSSTASDYGFSCINAQNYEMFIKMRTVGDMWGTGLFKANACDFCDDVTTELADISIGDAWLEPYFQDGKGSNVAVTRSALAELLIQRGIENNDLVLENLSLSKFLESQRGSFNHRHMGMPTRIRIARQKGLIVPPKRYENGFVPISFRKVQKLRMDVRKESLKVWQKYSDAILFDQAMKPKLSLLQQYTRTYHKRREWRQLPLKIFGKIRELVKI